MKVNNVLELENFQRYHFVILGFSNFKSIFKKIKNVMKFYRFSDEGIVNEREIIYDVSNNLLSDSGVILSKQYGEKKIKFIVTKISQLPGEMKRPSKEFLLGELETDAEPKDYSLQISSAIENSFSATFTVDLDSFVKQTYPKIRIDIKSRKYLIIGGTGYRAELYYEKVTYRDIKSRKTVMRDNITFKMWNTKEYNEENKQILDILDKKIKEIALFDLSRFEIAQKLLYPKDEGEVDSEEPKVDEE